MDASAALLNDTEKQIYTYSAQLPYLKIALAELREYFELANIPVTNETSAIISVTAGVTVLSMETTPALPSDLVEIQRLWERTQGSTEPFIPMTRVEFLPHNREGVSLAHLTFWAWHGQAVHFLPATTNRDVKLDYIKTLFSDLIDQNSTIGVINAESFLGFRTAALCAEFIGENKTRADDLNSFASVALDRLMGISVKGKQSIVTRRRPFRLSYKRRSIF